MLFGFVVFLFSEVGSSFRFDCFCLSILGVSDNVLVSYSLFVFWCISCNSRSENPHFFIIVLTWSASLSLVWKLAHSCSMSIIFFLYQLSIGLLLKQQCNASWLCSLFHLLCLRSWFVWFLRSSFVCLKIKTANIRRMTIESPLKTLKRAPADHDTQVCCLDSTLLYILIRHFYHRRHIVAIKIV